VVIRRPRPTVRSRIAVILSALVVGAGVVLLVASYELVRVNINSASANPPPPAVHGAPHMVPAGGSAPAVRALIAHHTLSVLVWQYAAIVAGLIAVSAVVAWSLAGRILRPVRAITATARRITSEGLHERLSLSGPPDELGELGDTFDSMLERL
jgi:methyl-accepting chemotaxis protein